ncbi:unnamed protein product [Cladocopium goreaui]|uniref:Uncharacterized protein n=1 Tax=Cladocopium goreaui TaxID=2562237 RepID=A0A9P1GIA2_9DINO|nr:unnamed protein product [Cladocopium goreaui]
MASWRVVMRRLGAAAMGACSECCPQVRTLTDVPRALWPIMSFYSELETEAQHGGSTEAAEWLETLRWYVDASAANYRSLNRFLRHGGTSGTSSSLAFRAAQLDALATVAPRLAEPLTLWRGLAVCPMCNI